MDKKENILNESLKVIDSFNKDPQYKELLKKLNIDNNSNNKDVISEELLLLLVNNQRFDLAQEEINKSKGK